MNCNCVWKQSGSNLTLNSSCSPENSLSPLVAWLCLKDERSFEILEAWKQAYRRFDFIAGAEVISGPVTFT